MRPIPYSRQSINENDIAAVANVLRGDWLTQGPSVAAFENAIADYCGAKFAVAFSNGTAALHAACAVANVSSGDEVLVPAISFAATANCARYVGATPRFVDVTAGLPLLDLDDATQQLSPHTKAIIPVHFSGATVDLLPLWKFAREKNLTVIEDACHALGAKYFDTDAQTWRTVGCCAHSQMTVFSFHPVKGITTGEGGLITTNDTATAQALVQFRQHGIVRRPNLAADVAWHYEMISLGYNYRLTDIQCALGLSQLARLDEFVAARRTRFAIYAKELGAHPTLKIFTPNAQTESAHHLAIIHTGSAPSRNALYRYLRDHEIHAQVHYMPIYHHPAYRNDPRWRDVSRARAENYYAGALSIPLFPDLTAADQAYVIDTLRAWSGA